MMTTEFEAAVKAANGKKPPGMGDFIVREMVKAALLAAEDVHSRNASLKDVVDTNKIDAISSKTFDIISNSPAPILKEEGPLVRGKPGNIFWPVDPVTGLPVTK